MANAVGIVGHSSESFSLSMDNAIVRKLKFETGRIVHGNTKGKEVFTEVQKWFYIP